MEPGSPSIFDITEQVSPHLDFTHASIHGAPLNFG